MIPPLLLYDFDSFVDLAVLLGIVLVFVDFVWAYLPVWWDCLSFIDLSPLQLRWGGLKSRKKAGVGWLAPEKYTDPPPCRGPPCNQNAL